ncbi:hypothetical protein QLX08_001545 [Tetragonisca angustula]|uniref:Uncharacterized protein n=1 Tax=Tetragonisca angustula TaxID=166442 RepID=A0AAW1AF31_9HYME
MCIGDPTRKTGKTEEGRRKHGEPESQARAREGRQSGRNATKEGTLRIGFLTVSFGPAADKTGHLDMGQLRGRVRLLRPSGSKEAFHGGETVPSFVLPVLGVYAVMAVYYGVYA